MLVFLNAIIFVNEMQMAGSSPICLSFFFEKKLLYVYHNIKANYFEISWNKPILCFFNICYIPEILKLFFFALVRWFNSLLLFFSFSRITTDVLGVFSRYYKHVIYAFFSVKKCIYMHINIEGINDWNEENYQTLW